MLVLGIGSLLWADEGFGVSAVEFLRDHYCFRENVTLMDGGTQGIHLVQNIREADILVAFDAIDYGLPGGTLRRIEGAEVPKFLGCKKISLHQTGFQEVLAMAEMLGDYPALRVEAVGFAGWQGCWLGVLITPWFMNLVLLPESARDWDNLMLGVKVAHRFPSGTYEFIVGNEGDVGPYQMCSLFSPMFGFAVQPAAAATAKVLLEGLMNEQNRDQTSMRQGEIARIWRGGDQDEAADSEMPSGSTLGQKLGEQVSRREV